MSSSQVTCPYCSVRLKPSRPVAAGKVLTCPKCGQSFAVPEEPDPEADAPEEDSPSDSSLSHEPLVSESQLSALEELTETGPDSEPPVVFHRQEVRRGTDSWTLPLVLGGGVFALALVVGLLVSHSRPDSQEPDTGARSTAPLSPETLVDESEADPGQVETPSPPEPETSRAAKLDPESAEAPPRQEGTNPAARSSRSDGARGILRTELSLLPTSPSYGAGQGPGITIVAGGAFRLYVDGEFLIEEIAGGTPRFVPLTLLPGKHTVAVLASQGVRPPGVLVQIDELEKPYLSGVNWKVSSSPPTKSWTAPTFDDIDWEKAAVVGDIRTRPVEGLSSNVLDRTTSWIWSPQSSDKQVALRFTFTIRAAGFARDVTGGEGGSVVVAKDADQIVRLLTSSDPLIILIPEGTYDFRQKRKAKAAANPKDPRDPSKGVNLRMVVGENFGRDPGAKMVDVELWDRRILVKGDKTIHGLGRGAFLRGASLTVSNARNVIVRNLCVFDVNPHVIEAGDGISGDNVEGLWVDHCTFRWISDGCDLTGDRGNRGVTFSWIHYNGANRWTIDGRQHYAAMVLNSEATYHHVWWESVNGRAPKVSGKQSRVHIYNNYYTDNTYHEVAVSDGAQVLLERSYFDDVRSPTMRETGGLIQGRNNFYKHLTGSHQLNKQASREPKDSVFTPPYSYTVDQTAAVPGLLRSRAGMGGPWGSEPEY